MNSTSHEPPQETACVPFSLTSLDQTKPVSTGPSLTPDPVRFEGFWYVVALSDQLKPNQVLSRTVLGEWLAIFRGPEGQPVALRDRCTHRNSRLSKGQVKQGNLQCPYHGWTYDATGTVVAVPAEGIDFKSLQSRCAQRYDTCEQDGYVYVRLRKTAVNFQPFSMPCYGEPGWATVRVINRFPNTVTNCVENFIDVPHTASVHPGVFRKPSQQKLEMTIEQRNGSVFVNYQHETTNLGWFSRFLNPKQQEIRHTDSFHMPNVTSVEYDMGPNRRLFITSQSIPETETSTLVYTDITFNYGIWNWIARPFVRWTAQHIIRQDINALKIQQEAIEKYGQRFSNTSADTIHLWVESIRNAIASGQDPRQLPHQSVNLTFWV